MNSHRPLSPSPIHFSVVIPAYNEANYIGHCLKSLTHQKFPHPFEVIVVDNNSTDATSAVSHSFQSRLNLTIITEPRKGRGFARAAGFHYAHGDIIFSTDADNILTQYWLSSLSAPLQNSSPFIASTSTFIFSDCSPLVTSILGFLQPLSMKTYRLLSGYYWLNGSSFAIRKSVYQQSGGFDPHTNALEDIHLSEKLSSLGKIAFIPQPLATSSGRRFRSSLIKGLLSYLTAYLIYLKSKSASVLPDIR